MAYGARLESEFTRKGIESSNLSPSAKVNSSPLQVSYLLILTDFVLLNSSAQIRICESGPRMTLSAVAVPSDM